MRYVYYSSSLYHGERKDHKYIYREGVSGNYKYYYEPDTKKQKERETEKWYKDQANHAIKAIGEAARQYNRTKEEKEKRKAEEEAARSENTKKLVQDVIEYALSKHKRNN